MPLILIQCSRSPLSLFQFHHILSLYLSLSSLPWPTVTAASSSDHLAPSLSSSAAAIKSDAPFDDPCRDAVRWARSESSSVVCLYHFKDLIYTYAHTDLICVYVCVYVYICMYVANLFVYMCICVCI